MRRLEMKVLARIGGKSSAQPRLGSFGAVGSATCRMPLLLFSPQDGATSARRQTMAGSFRPSGSTPGEVY